MDFFRPHKRTEIQSNVGEKFNRNKFKIVIAHVYYRWYNNILKIAFKVQLVSCQPDKNSSLKNHKTIFLDEKA